MMKSAFLLLTALITLSPGTVHAQAVRTVGVHEEQVSSVAYAPDGESLVAASFDGAINVWDPETGKRLQTINKPDPDDVVRNVVYARDGNTIAWIGSSDMNTIFVWDVKKAAIRNTWKVYRKYEEGNVFSLSYTPDSRMLVSNGLVFAKSEECIKVWDNTTGKQVKVHFSVFQDKYSGSLTSGVFHDSSMIATACEHRDVYLLDLKTGAKVATVPHRSAFAAAFAHEGWRVATAGKEQIQIWEITTATKQVTINVPKATFLSVQFSPDDKLVTAVDIDSPDICIWDASTGEEKLKLTGHTDSVWSVAFSPDGKSLASGSTDKTVKVWDISKLK